MNNRAIGSPYLAIIILKINDYIFLSKDMKSLNGQNKTKQDPSIH